MDTNFLACMLAIMLIGFGLFAAWQFVIGSQTTGKKEKFLPIIWDTCDQPRTLGIRNEGLTQGAQYDGMPVHRVGPVLNFHQKFKPFLPELGWRAVWLSNYTDYQVPPDTNFDGTMIRPFLDNLENIDNIYRKC